MPVDPNQLAQRLQNMQAQGYSSLPFQAQGSLANSGVPNEQLNQTAENFRQADQASSGPASYWFDDPVLQKSDSPALQIKRYVTAAFGAWPIQERDLQKIQKSMQKGGYGKHLDANGVWNSAWYAQYQQANQNRIQQSRQGNTGSWFSKGVAGVLKEAGHFLPEGVISTAAGIIKAIPGQLRTAGEDVLAGPNPNLDLGYGTGAQSAGALGRITGDPNVQSAEDYNQQLAHHGLERGLNDINTAFLLTSTVGRALPLMRAAGEGMLGAEGASQAEIAAQRAALTPATAEEAAQGGGLVSRAPLHNPGITAGYLGRNFATNSFLDDATGQVVHEAVNTGLRPALGRFTGGAITGAAVGGIGAGITGQNPVKGAALGAAIGGVGMSLAGTQAVRNMPVLGRIAPAIDDLVNPYAVNAEGEGVAAGSSNAAREIQGSYYRFRNGDWNPYMRNTVFGDAVRTAGAATQKTSGIIGLAGVGSDIAHHFDPNSTWGKISEDKTGQMVNGKFVEFQKNILPFSPVQANINDLVFLLHGSPHGDEALSHIVGPRAANVVAPTYEAFSDRNGQAISWANDGLSLEEVAAKHFGGDIQGMMEFYTPKIEGVTAHDQAKEAIQNLVNADRPLPGTPEYTRMLRDYEGRIKANRPKLLEDTAKNMSDSGSARHYAEELRNQFIRAENMPGQFANDAQGWVGARRIMVDDVHQYSVANEEAWNKVDAADMHADAHHIDMERSIDQIRSITNEVDDPLLQGHFRNIRNIMQTALGDEKQYKQLLGKAMRSGDQDLIDQLNAKHEAAVTTTQNVLEEAKGQIPIWKEGQGRIEPMTPNQQAVLDQSTDDFLTHKDMWNKSLDDHNREYLLVNPSLAHQAGQLGIAGRDTMTYEGGNHVIGTLEKIMGQTGSGSLEGTGLRGIEQRLINGDQLGNAWNQEEAGISRADLLQDVQAQKQDVSNSLIHFISQELGQNAKDPLVFGRAVQGETVDARFDGLMEYAKTQVDDLAREVQLTDDAPEALRAAFAKMDALGYKPVMGHDVGLDYLPYTQMDATAGQLTATRRLADHLGLAWEPTAQADINATYQNALYKRLASAIHEGQFENYPGMTPMTWVKVFRNVADEETPGFISSMTSQLGQRLGAYGGATDAPWRKFIGKAGDAIAADSASEFDRRVQEFLRRNPASSIREAEDASIGGMTRSMMVRHGLRDMSQGKFINKMMDPAFFKRLVPDIALHEEALGIEAHGFAKTLDEAGRMYHSVKVAYSDVPMSMVGLEKLENIVRSSMGFLGEGHLNVGGYELSKPATRIVGGATLGAIGGIAAGDKSSPGDYLKSAIEGGTVGATIAGGLNIAHNRGIVDADRMGWAMSNLPNNLIKARNQWRFNLSPMFSLRRQVKTAVKMSLEGNVAPVMRPANYLIHSEEGFEPAMARLNRIFPPMKDLPGWDDAADSAVRMIEDNDMFGIYNAKVNMAYMAQGMSKQGHSDQEIRDSIEKVFNYTSGSKTGGTQVLGRSALERSANFAFFPFSFDKRLYSAMAGYLLDRPAQQVLLTGALATYAEFQKSIDENNPLSTKWLENHFPILQSAEKLNALAHGLSPGEAGGINRPLMNAFLPQVWHPNTANNVVLGGFIPMIKDLKDVTSQLAQQGSIFRAGGLQMYNLLPIAKGYTRFGNPGPSTLSNYAQQSSAFTMQAEWYEKYSKILDYNQGRPLSEQIKFPNTNDYGQYGGMGITKQNIKDIIKKRYPYYDPNAAVSIAADNQTAIRTYIEGKKGTADGKYAEVLLDLMNKLGPKFANNSIPASQGRDAMQSIRNAAISLAGRDSDFYKIYQKNYQKLFGPLEEFSNG